MAFGLGYHRKNRSGGLGERTKEEVLLNAIQGKFSEFRFYNYSLGLKKNTTYPDLNVYGKGKWDDGDFIVKNRKISVKSTKNYSKLLLLEKKIGILRGDIFLILELKMNPSMN